MGNDELSEFDWDNFEEQTNRISILKAYDKDNWSDWLNDILNYGIAHPISKLGDGGDIIMDIVPFLKKNRISCYPYEKAIAEVIHQYTGKAEYSDFLIRLLNAIREIKGSKCNQIVIDILTSEWNANHHFKGNYVKSAALGTLCRVASLEDHQISRVKSYNRDFGYIQMTHDSEYIGYGLRFIYLQDGLNSYFDELTFVRKQNLVLNEKQTYVVSRMLWETFRNKRDIFYAQLFKWLIVNADIERESLWDITVRRFYTRTSAQLKQLWDDWSENSVFRASEKLPSERPYALAVKFLLDTILEETPNKSVVPTIVFETLCFIEMNTNGELANILYKHDDYIYNHFKYVIQFQTSSWARKSPKAANRIIKVLGEINNAKNPENNFMSLFAQDPKSFIQKIKEEVDRSSKEIKRSSKDVATTKSV